MAEDKTQQPTDTRHDPALIRIAQAEFLYKDTVATVLSSFIAALTVIPAYFLVADRFRLYAWLGIFSFITLARYLSARRYLHLPRDLDSADRALKVFMLGALASGTAWGISALFFVPFSALPEYQALLYTYLYVLYCCALSAGSIAHYAAHKPVWYCFATPCTLPVIAFLFLVPDVTRNIIGILMLVFLLFITRSMRSVNETIMTSLLLRIDRADLARFLEQERERVYLLNRDLQEDIEKRKQTEDELRRAKSEAEQMAAELLTLSSQDGLTGVQNRRAFDRFLEEEWNRATRARQPLALIMCDIDCYKSYNDRYGHQQGDECLIKIARLLQTFSRRSGEMTARYGGEEFVLILAGTALQEAETLAEQIRQSVMALNIPHEDSPVASCITLSLGVSVVVPNLNMEASELVSAADNALYEAKSKGRNCVVARAVDDDRIREQMIAYTGDNEAEKQIPAMEKDETTGHGIQVERWNRDITASETVVRKMLESMGYRCSRYEYPPGSVFEEHSHGCDKLDAVLSGCLRLTSEGQSYDLHAGDYAYIPRGVVHRAEVIGNATVVSLDGVKG